MLVCSLSSSPVERDVAICRAMFDKDPEKLIELVSEWLEDNRLTLGGDFSVPAYLAQVLSEAEWSVANNARRPMLLS